MFSSGTGATSPQSRSISSPYNRPALLRRRDGSIRCGAPTSCTYTTRSGCFRTSTPVAPAWSRWMWVSSSARGSIASRAPTLEAGPGSTTTPSSTYAPITRSRPRWCTSISRPTPRTLQFPHMSDARLPERDRPWVMRTYAGHSTAKESNELYRRNIEKGQTGLSIAFDLPTQTGYDPDDELARGEVGKVGVSIAHKGDMHTLLDGIPLQEMNTSMTINATAAWLLALYMTVAEENGVEAAALQGTTQNDIIKEFLSRGTYAFPPGPSMRLIADMIAFTVDEVPKWNPINICSYHLQEAGATPVQEIAYSLSTARAVLDQVRERVDHETFPRVFGRISFFVNAGIRFMEEL